MGKSGFRRTYTPDRRSHGVHRPVPGPIMHFYQCVPGPHDGWALSFAGTGAAVAHGDYNKGASGAGSIKDTGGLYGHLPGRVLTMIWFLRWR